MAGPPPGNTACLNCGGRRTPLPTKRNAIMLCLIQCGETEWDVNGRIQGSADLPLSEVGRASITSELNRLSVVRAGMVFHPPDEAAAETASICARRIGARTKAVTELADPHLGVLEGLGEQDFAERFPTRYRQWEEDPISLAPPQGEEVIAAADRMFSTVARILRRSRSGEIAIVFHRLNLAMMRCWLANRPLQELRTMLINRPRIERYALPMELLEALESAAREPVAARSSG
jgi:broad specificity phosphatase PhoE